MKDAGSLDYTRDKCTQLKELIQADIAGFGGNPPLSKVLDLLHVQLETMNMPTSEGQNKSSLLIDDL
jgi:hypothetical protein